MRALLAALLLLVTSPAAADCPQWLIGDMASRGVPAREIARMCGPPPVRSLVVPRPAAPAPSAAPPSAAAPRLQMMLPPPVTAVEPPVPSNRCVPDDGPACSTSSLRPIGSPCWCTLPRGGYAEGTIRQ